MAPRQPPSSEFQARYLAALRADLAAGRSSSREHADGIGSDARELGLETLALARVHDAAVAVLTADARDARGRRRITARTETFFTTAVSHMAVDHATVADTRTENGRLLASLDASGTELTAVRQQLAGEIERRKVAERRAAALEKENRRMVSKAHDMNNERRALTRHLLASQDEERRRISRDLHDALGQTLAGAHIALAKLASDAEVSSKDLRANVAYTRRLVQRSMKTVHRFATELHPAALDDLGLVPALGSLTKGLSGPGGPNVDFAVEGDFPHLDESRSTALYRVAQEALTNARRHARANNVRIVLRRSHGVIQLDVSDDGRGFDPARANRARARRRLGLVCMRERMEMIGGTLAIDSSPGHGTTIRAEIRMEEEADDKPSDKPGSAD